MRNGWQTPRYCPYRSAKDIDCRDPKLPITSDNTSSKPRIEINYHVGEPARANWRVSACNREIQCTCRNWINTSAVQSVGRYSPKHHYRPPLRLRCAPNKQLSLLASLYKRRQNSPLKRAIHGPSLHARQSHAHRLHDYAHHASTVQQIAVDDVKPARRSKEAGREDPWRCESRGRNNVSL
jgi:hypothetical protein